MVGTFSMELYWAVPSRNIERPLPSASGTQAMQWLNLPTWASVMSSSERLWLAMMRTG